MAINPEPRIVLNDGQTNQMQEITSWLGNLAQVAEQSSPRQMSARAALQLALEQKEASATKSIGVEFAAPAGVIPIFNDGSSNGGPVLHNSQPNKPEEFIDTGEEFSMPVQVTTPVLRPNQAQRSSVRKPTVQGAVHEGVVDAVSPPVKIDIEFKYAGRLTVQYHAAITVGQVLVLIYDHSSPVLLNRWVPPAPVEGEPSDPFAMLVREPNKDPVVYLAHYTGLTFRDGNREYFILTVEQAAMADDE